MNTTGANQGLEIVLTNPMHRRDQESEDRGRKKGRERRKGGRDRDKDRHRDRGDTHKKIRTRGGREQTRANEAIFFLGHTLHQKSESGALIQELSSVLSFFLQFLGI